jgi:hypothetical protein
MDKSSIFFSKGCPETVKESIKAEIEVQRETLSEKYLGMPSSVGRSKSGAFKYLKDKVWKKGFGLVGTIAFCWWEGDSHKVCSSGSSNLLYGFL